MTCPRRIPFLSPGLAIGAKRHEGFADAWNWLIHSFWHMTLGTGLKWEDKWGGYPKINLKIEAGAGIAVKYSDGKIIISTGTGETTEDDESGGGGVDDNSDYDSGDSGGYHADDGEHAHSDGSTTGGGGGGASAGGAGGGIGEASVSGDGAGSNGGGGGADCNQFSGESVDMGEEDPGIGNFGDDCAVINGW
jgi:hypothetical protein